MSGYTIPTTLYSVFPTLVGLGWSVKRKPMWKTLLRETPTGVDSAVGLMAYPRWQWELTHEFLRSDAVKQEFQTLVGFFNQCRASAVPFLYLDKVDNAAVMALFAAADGVTSSFQLMRPFGGFTEPVLAPYGTVRVFWSGLAINSTVPLSGLRLSIQAGSAFFDAPGLLSLNYPGCPITLTDSQGHKATGFIGALGSVENYGAEQVSGGDFSSATGWTLDSGWAITSGVARATAAGVGHGVVEQKQLEAGACYKVGLSIPAYTSGILDLDMDGAAYPAGFASSGSQTAYVTSKGLNSWLGFLARTAVTLDADNFSVKKVTAPSSTGVTIVSASGGATQSFTSIDAGFISNDPNGYLVQVQVNNVELQGGTDFTVSLLGLVTFTHAPVAGHTLYWTGNFYWVCRFVDDEAEFENFMWNLWQNSKLRFISKKLPGLG